MHALRSLGVGCEFQVDASNLSTKFGGQNFHTIHMTMPFVRGARYADGRMPTAKLVHGFFRSAAMHQRDGQRILLTLPYYYKRKEQLSLGDRYRVYEAAKDAGYGLKDIRVFMADSKPAFAGYFHTTTADTGYYTPVNLREYVFVKGWELKKVDPTTERFRKANNQQLLVLNTEGIAVNPTCKAAGPAGFAWY